MQENISQILQVKTPVKPAKPWLKIVLFVCLGLLLVGGLVFAGYQLGKRKTQPILQLIPTPTAVATPTPDSTADWKIYTNTKYRFSLKYPPDWGKGYDAPLDEENRIRRVRYVLSTKDRAHWLGGPPRGYLLAQGAELFIEIFTTIQAEEAMGAEVLISDKKAQQVKKITIADSVPAIKYTLPPSYLSETPTEVDFIKDGLLYRLTFFYSKDYRERSQEGPESVFDQILSTFKFLD
jgi:hypothetical protein